jgi:hypothetical protein
MRCFMAIASMKIMPRGHPTTVPLPQDVVGRQKQLRPGFMGNQKNLRFANRIGG